MPPQEPPESWFKLRAALGRISEPELVDIGDNRIAKLEGHFGWAVMLAGIGGAGGGAAMIFVAAEVARRFGLNVDIVRTIGRSAATVGVDEFRGGIGIAVVTGALVGMLFGALMRHALRMVARLLAGVLLATALWTLLHAFVFKTFAAVSLGALPYGPMIAGVAVYGICVAILPPPRKLVFEDD